MGFFSLCEASAGWLIVFGARTLAPAQISYPFFFHRKFLDKLFFSDLHSNRSHIVRGCFVFRFITCVFDLGCLILVAYQCLTSVTRR